MRTESAALLSTAPRVCRALVVERKVACMECSRMPQEIVDSVVAACRPANNIFDACICWQEHCDHQPYVMITPRRLMFSVSFTDPAAVACKKAHC